MKDKADAVKCLYRQRDKFILIGLTGRTGAGCTTVAKILSTDNINELDLKDSKTCDFKHSDERKYSIVYRFMAEDERWKKFTVIEASSIIFSFILEGTYKNLFNYIDKISNEVEIKEKEELKKNIVEVLSEEKVENIKKALSKVAVKGRVEIVPVSSKYSVIIDYAHNGVSMQSILETMRAYNPKRIVSLFGCGGNRSKERRYDMGEISGRLADFTIVTEDNSRYEDINDIMNDIEIGLKKTSGKYIKIPSRKDAIKYAIDNAKEGDIILLLGKGHETYREINGVREHLDEREIIKEILNNK